MRGRGGVSLALFMLCAALPSAAVAAPSESERARAAATDDKPGRVEVALVGALEDDPPLFERIRSLFPNDTAVVLRSGGQLDASTVLQPERPGTLYLWVRMGSRVQARVYAAVREPSGGSARYLFRDVRLESGLDEVGGESLAQIAHSTAEALWLREQETPEHQVVEALRSDTVAERDDPAPTASSEGSAARDAAPVLDAGVAPQPRRGDRPFDFGFGAGISTHWSGVEGWMAEPAVFVTAELREQFSLRAAALYLIPTEFDVLPATVRLTGASGELRVGWVQDNARAARLRVEAGFSVLVARWSSIVADSDARARANSPRSFVRPSALAAGAFEWPIGPAWIGARAELRVALRKTRYEIEGGTAAASSSNWSPGGGLEFGLLLDPEVR